MSTPRVKGTRSNAGCLNCRKDRKGCDEEKPDCQRCVRRGHACVWPEPQHSSLWPAANGVSAAYSLLPGGRFTTPDLISHPRRNSGDLLHPSPIIEMRLSSDALLASLPLGIPATQAEREALAFYHTRPTFGYGNKSPQYSTHTIVWRRLLSNKAVVHLLLAAALAQMGWRDILDWLPDSAELHYSLGRQELQKQVVAEGVDAFTMLTAFWFMYLYQRQRPTPDRGDLSNEVAAYLEHTRLHEIVTSPDENPLWPENSKALTACLLTWLFWADAQAGTQGKGGGMARLLMQSGSELVLDLREIAKDALRLNWDRYPNSQLVDDIQNSAPFDMIHSIMILGQEINNRVGDDRLLRPDASLEISSKIDNLRRKSAFRAIMHLAMSAEPNRGRMTKNSEWATALYFALKVYHFRCGMTAETESFFSTGSNVISQTVSSMMLLLQRSLAMNDEGQADRLQLPLFWAGIETTSPIEKTWILSELKHGALNRALRHIYQEQENGRRVGMARLHQLLDASCVGLPEMGMGASPGIDTDMDLSMFC
ncbi:hypothetical protein QBC35DRAFT_512725 [Podospora australis]|uniref:Zn(2)-C6 fungal-type domain-containing protein n=1 Tax=Podospora australis TaxID=1536484 RepID=A0AAN7AJS9_9PEZI|nr:hypothetical protein QBC35DRAFT_512725 [Podospora australis]